MNRSALILVLLLGCTPPPPTGCETTEPAPNARLQEILDQLTSSGAPGAVLRVQRRGSPAWLGASGFSQLETRTPMQPCTPFPIASVTKMMVAVAVLSLVEEGRLSLDAELDQLLAHTSGLPDYSETPEQGLRSLNDPTRSWTTEEALAFVRGQPRRFEPGTRFEYSNTNYVLLGSRLEDVTGAPFVKTLEARVFQKAGMTHTQLGIDAAPSALTNGYRDVRGDGVLTNTTLFRHPSRTADGGLVSTAEDLGRFLDAWAHDRLLQRTSRERMSTWTDGSDSGRGLFRTDEGHSVGHTGASMRVFTVARYFPETDTSLVLLTNASTPPTGPLADAQRRALADLATEVLR